MTGTATQAAELGRPVDFADAAWQFMVAVYRLEGVPALCLELQERCDADIPLLLLLVIADREEMGPASGDLEALIDRGRLWQATTVRPLRALRVAMRGIVQGPAETAFREKIKQAELDAEELHVARLARAFCHRGQADRLAPAYLAALSVPAADARSAVARLDEALAAVSADCLENQKDKDLMRSWPISTA